MRHFLARASTCVAALFTFGSVTHCERAVQDLGDDGRDDAGTPSDAATDGGIDAGSDALVVEADGSGLPWGCGVAQPVALQDGASDRVWVGPGPTGELAAIGLGRGEQGEGIYFRRYDLTGRAIGVSPRIAPATSAEGPPHRVAAIFTGTTYGVVWPSFITDGVNDATFRFTLLDVGGNTRASTKLTPVSTFATVLETRVVWTGTTYLVFFQDTFRIVHALVVDGAGMPVGTDRAIGIEPTSGFSVAWTGAAVGLLYGSDRDVRFLRISAEGAPVGTPVTVATVAHAASTPEIAWLGDRYACAVVDDDAGRGTVQLFVIGEGGVAQGGSHTFGPATTPSYAKGEHPIALAYDGASLGVAFSDDRDGLMNEIYFAKASLSGERLGSDTRVTVTSTANGGRSEQPSLVPTANGGVVVYRTFAESGFATMMRSPCP